MLILVDMKNLSIIFLTLILSGIVNGNVSFSIDYTDETVHANGTTELTLSAEWPQGSNSYIIYTPVMPQLLGLKIIDHITFGQSLTVNSQVVQRAVHLFKFAVTNSAGTEAETGPIFIEYRLSGSKEKLHRQLSGVKYKVTRFRSNFLKVLIPVIIILLLLPVILTIVIIKVSRKKMKVVVSDNLSIEDAIIKKLENVKRYKLEGDVKKYFHELSELIKKYFRKKYQIGSILDFTPKSIGKVGPDKHTLFTACELLRLSHDVCYADYQPSDHEQERIYKFLKKMLTKNRPHKSNVEDELYLK
jgi:hypothetical protein